MIVTRVEANTSTQDPIDMGISKDPFAAHRSPGDDPFASQRDEDALGDLSGSPPSNVGSPADRRMSKEWGKRPAPIHCSVVKALYKPC